MQCNLFAPQVKLRTKISMEQERVIGEMNTRTSKIEEDLVRAQRALEEKGRECDRLAEQLDSALAKLEESKQLLKTNENGAASCIQYLYSQRRSFMFTQNIDG